MRSKELCLKYNLGKELEQTLVDILNNKLLHNVDSRENIYKRSIDKSIEKENIDDEDSFKCDIVVNITNQKRPLKVINDELNESSEIYGKMKTILKNIKEDTLNLSSLNEEKLIPIEKDKEKSHNRRCASFLTRKEKIETSNYLYLNALDKLKEHEYIAQKAKLDKEQKELAFCSFKPFINKGINIQKNSIVNNSFDDRQRKFQELKESKIKITKKANEKTQKNECTFQPKIIDNLNLELNTTRKGSNIYHFHCYMWGNDFCNINKLCFKNYRRYPKRRCRIKVK